MVTIVQSGLKLCHLWAILSADSLQKFLLLWHLQQQLFTNIRTDFQMINNKRFVLSPTVCLLFSSESKSDESVTKATWEMLCCPQEHGPIARHVQKDGRLLQVMQNSPGLFRGEGFDCGRSCHDLQGSTADGMNNEEIDDKTR